jgi:hypothetical protein
VLALQASAAAAQRLTLNVAQSSIVLPSADPDTTPSIAARTRTASRPVLWIVMACVVAPPESVFSSTRSGDTSTDTCADAGDTLTDAASATAPTA